MPSAANTVYRQYRAGTNTAPGSEEKPSSPASWNGAASAAPFQLRGDPVEVMLGKTQRELFPLELLPFFRKHRRELRQNRAGEDLFRLLQREALRLVEIAADEIENIVIGIQPLPLCAALRHNDAGAVVVADRLRRDAGQSRYVVDGVLRICHVMPVIHKVFPLSRMNTRILYQTAPPFGYTAAQKKAKKSALREA